MPSPALVTVHSWLPGTVNKNFISLQAAIEYAGENINQLQAIEILVRTGTHRYAILEGRQLAALIEMVCTTH
ncbi:hypothetical protein [Rhizobium leguminosarum]|uniref:hypothetical protein n=1 Tax=Rhizobium leguminosarum TaxID=384 RepID=UPI00103F7CF0|nr:hypothetical protein [Rhizobium leguminosarum]TBY48318.1 hypothetical protein E0H54_10250 [Rhizobium leguminosarum bv. viciae]